MFGDGMDLESSGSTLRRKKDPFQRELQKKLKDRRSRGLSADITSPEEESDLSAEDDFLSQFMTSKKREDRPRSATRRNPPSFLKSQRGSDWTPGLGDTLRPGAAGDMLGRITRGDDDDDDDDDDDSEMTLTFGPSKKSPRDLDGGKHKHQQGEKLSKEDIIFGRKSSSPRESKLSHRGSKEEKGMWQPPNFRKTQKPESDNNRSTSPASSKGRFTPSLEPMLEPITETPTPRTRRLSQASEKTKSQDSGKEDSPRPKPKPRGKTDETSSSGRRTPISELFGKSDKSSDFSTGRKTPPTDIFGKSGQPSALDFLEDDKSEEKPTVTPRRRASKPDVKSRTKSSSPAGRKVSVQEKTGEKQSEQKKEDDIGSRRASVLDFLTEDTKPKKQPRKSSLQRANSRDSITDELESFESKMKTSGHRSRSQSRGTPKLEREASASSICEEIQMEPLQQTSNDTQEQVITKGSDKQTTEKQRANDAINLVANAQDDKTMQFIEPDKDKDKNKKAETKHPKQRPKPRYPSKPGEESPTSTASFDDTVSIRNAIYAEWYKERTKKAKEALKEKKKQEATEEEKKRKEALDKQLENKASYNAWMEKKAPVCKQKIKQKKEEEKKKEDELKEKEKKKKEAEKTFQIWKEKKDSLIKTKVHKELNLEKTKTREASEIKRQKEKQNESAYKSWKDRKDKVIHTKVKEEKSKERVETEKEKEIRRKKEQEAEKLYEEWMRKKEEQEKAEKRRERQRRLEQEEEFRPAWSPANRTIPFGR